MNPPNRIPMKTLLLSCCIVAAGAGLSAGTAFEEHLIAGGLTYPYGINAADLNGDGKIDLTLADARKDNAVYWFENDGAGKFTRHLAYRLPPPSWRLERHELADVNKDGLIDIVIVENSAGCLIWLENPGPAGIRGLWREHFITLSTRVPGAYDVAVGDVDGDGWPDVAASSWRMGNMFSWHRNPGLALPKGGDYRITAATDNNWAEWKQYNVAENLLETRMIRLADMDGDGDLDMAGTATRSGTVLWLENPGKDLVTSEPHPFSTGYGTRLMWAQHVIDRTGRPAHGQVADMDGDGDPDLLLASGMAAEIVPSEVMPVVHEVTWHENLGGGKGWKKHVIATPFPEAFEAVAADFDQDGDLDVVVTAWIAETGVSLAWFENNGSDRWTAHPLKKDWPHAVQVITADIDGDGRTDIVASAEDGAAELRWWRNAGAAR
jgi:hypothetical protein